MAPSIEFRVRLDGQVAVIQPEGKLTIGERSEALRRAVDSAFAAGARILLVDCTLVPYAVSSGIGELLAAMRRARDAGGGVGLFGPRGKVHEVLEITKLADYFSIALTEAEARAGLPVAAT